MLSKLRLYLIWGGIWSVLLIGCGRSSNQEDFVSVPVSLSNGFGLDLTTTLSNVQLSVTGCVSQYAPTNFTFNGSTINLLRNDTGCLVKICSFTYNGENYTNLSPPCGIFNTTEGSLTTFNGTGGANPGGDSVSAYVSKQISGAISPSTTVEFYILEFSNYGNVSVPVNSTILTVQNSSPSSSPYTVSDTTSSVAFRFRRLYPSPPPSSSVLVNYTIVGSALAGTDYTAPSGSITIPANSAEAILTIPLINNTNAREPESLGVYIESSSGLQGVPSYNSYGSPAVIITNSDTTISTTNLVFHANNTSFVGSPITAWNSVSPATINTSSTTGSPTRNVASLNGLDTAGFSGSNFMTIASNTQINRSASSRKVVTAVFVTPSDIASRQVIYEQGNTTSGLNIYIFNGKIYASTWAGSGATTNVSAYILPSSAYSFSFSFDATGGFNKIYLSGALVGQTAGPASMSNQNVSSGIGGVAGSTRFENGTTTTAVTGFKGSIAELFLYNGTLTDTQIRGLHGFLDAKYNLSFPAVSISAVQATVGENEGEVKGFIVSRAIPQSTPLTVYYTASGTAVAGTNYVTLPGSVTIPAFNSSVYTFLTPVNNNVAGDTNTLTLTIANDANDGTTPITYLGSPVSASLNIVDYVASSSSPPIVWLDAAKGITVAGGAVKTWVDQTGNSINGSQGAGAHRATSFSTANPPYVDFVGTSTANAQDLSLSTNALLDSAASYTMKTFAVVFKTGSDVTTSQVIYKQGNTTNGMNISIRAGNLYFVAYGASWSPTLVSISNSITTNTKYEVIFEYDQPNNQLRGKLNGIVLTPLTGVGTLVGVSGSTGIGACFSSTNTGCKYDNGTTSTTQHSNFLLGTTHPEIFEILIFNKILDSSTYATLENYLRNKYGI